MHWSVIDLPWLLQACGFCFHELWLAPSRSSALALSCSYHGPGLDFSRTASSALPYNLSVLAQICSCWFCFGVCPGLPCLGPFSVHTFPCSVWLCMPCPELLAQDAAVHYRILSVLARFLSVSKSKPFHSELRKLLDSSQWTGHFSGFSEAAKNQYDWSSKDLISYIKLGAPRHSPVNLESRPGRTAGTYPPGSGFWEVPPRNRNFLDFPGNFPKLSFFNIFKIKWPKVEEKSEFWGRWVWRTWVRPPPSQNFGARPLPVDMCRGPTIIFKCWHPWQNADIALRSSGFSNCSK